MPTKTAPPSAPPCAVADRLALEMADAERKAWDALGRYKFTMFGYWAAIWVHLNRVGKFRRDNPFRACVELARDVKAQNSS